MDEIGRNNFWKKDLLGFVMAKYDLLYGYERIASHDPTGDEYGQEIDNLVTFWNYCIE